MQLISPRRRSVIYKLSVTRHSGTAVTANLRGSLHGIVTCEKNIFLDGRGSSVPVTAGRRPQAGCRPARYFVSQRRSSNWVTSVSAREGNRLDGTFSGTFYYSRPGRLVLFTMGCPYHPARVRNVQKRIKERTAASYLGIAHADAGERERARGSGIARARARGKNTAGVVLYI